MPVDAGNLGLRTRSGVKGKHARENDHRHRVRRPDARGANDPFLLIAGETPLSGPCDERSAAFTTWDATRWKKTRTFTLIDELRMGNGTYADGDPPANVIGCWSSFFEEDRSFDGAA